MLDNINFENYKQFILGNFRDYFCFIIYTVEDVFAYKVYIEDGKFYIIDRKATAGKKYITLDYLNPSTNNILDYFIFDKDKQYRKDFNDPIKNIKTENYNGEEEFSYIEKCYTSDKFKDKFKFVSMCNNMKFNDDGIIYVSSCTYYDLEEV